MSAKDLTKVMSVRIPAIYFQRLGFLAYQTGKLPSEVAREMIVSYLNLGCMACGGPVTELEEAFGTFLGTCTNPDCVTAEPGLERVTGVSDFSDVQDKASLPGFPA